MASQVLTLVSVLVSREIPTLKSSVRMVDNLHVPGLDIVISLLSSLRMSSLSIVISSWVGYDSAGVWNPSMAATASAMVSS